MEDNLVTIASYTEAFEAEMAKGFLKIPGLRSFCKMSVSSACIHRWQGICI